MVFCWVGDLCRLVEESEEHESWLEQRKEGGRSPSALLCMGLLMG